MTRRQRRALRAARKAAPLPSQRIRQEGKGRRKDGLEKPVHVVFGDVDQCTCPICAQLAARGESYFTMGPDGELTEVTPPTPEMMTIYVRRHASMAPHLSETWQELRIPVGCNLGDACEYLRSTDPKLASEYAPGSLVGTVDGCPKTRSYILKPNEQVQVSGVPSKDWQDFISQSPSAGVLDFVRN